MRKGEYRLDKYSTTEEPKIPETEEVWHPAHFKRIVLPEKLSSLRQKLYHKAKMEPGFRFYVLYDRIFRRDVLESAYRIIRTNSRRNGKEKAPGVDGVTFEQIETTSDGVKSLIDTLHEELKAKTYRPLAVRRGYIEKPDGGKRPLGILVIRDRVVQMATLLVIEPIFEADFLDCSHGFRPERSAHGALEQIRENLKRGRTAVYDADLAGYFDSIPHDKLIKALRVRIVDRSVLKLIRMWLKSPIIESDDRGGKKVKRSDRGTPQGGVISPILANIYLHYFDKLFHMSKGPLHWANARLVRYADDFVIMARYQGKRLQTFVEETLEGRFGLTLNREKTSVVQMRNPGASLDFLGFTFRYDRDLHGRQRKYLNIMPSRKALKHERDKIRELTHTSRCFVPVPDLVEEVNRQLLGWSQYFRFGYPRQSFRDMNSFVRCRLIRHLRRRSQRAYRPPQGKSFYAHLSDLGLCYL